MDTIVLIVAALAVLTLGWVPTLVVVAALWVFVWVPLRWSGRIVAEREKRDFEARLRKIRERRSHG